MRQHIRNPPREQQKDLDHTADAAQWIRNNPAVRESVAYLLDRATNATGGQELRGMAARM